MSKIVENKKSKVLIVDDEQSILNALFRSLRDEFDVLLSLNGASALEIMREQEISVILTDQRMAGMDGIKLLSKAMEIQPDTVRVLITGYTDIETVIDAINDGQIFYYIQKPWEPDEIRAIMKRAAERYQLIQDNKRLVLELDNANQILGKENIDLKKEVEKQYSFKKIIGNSTGLVKVLDLVKKIIPTNTTVLISGETGTGKELIARAIHFNGPRKNKVFLAQNCAALPDTLLESELFGHKRGAFTDAVEDKKGLFELADGGTIFLDEIADTSLAFQQRLLRVLQEGELQALGSTNPKQVDVRIISAVNRNLDKAVHDGRFREDLYYRINVFPIHIPPLRERIDDIPLLVEYFMSKYSLQNNKNIRGISKEALQVLMQHEFPGNVRELENLIERAIVLSEPGTLINSSVFELTKNQILKSDASGTLYTPLSLREMTDSLERQVIFRSLNNNNGNISKTATELGLSRAGLYKKIKRYNLE